MAVRIGVVADKGGVGRTDVIKMLAEAMAIQGAKVLCVDMDYHAILSRRLGYDMYDADEALPSTAQLMQPSQPEGSAATIMQPCRWDTPWAGNISLLPASQALGDIEHNPGMGNATGRLLRALTGADDDFHVALFDTRPDMGKNSQAVWAACDYLVGITPPLRDGAEGLLRLLVNALDLAPDLNNPDLRVLGVVLNEYYEGSSAQSVQGSTRNLLAEGLALFTPPIRLFDNTIPRRTYIEYAASQGVPLTQYVSGDTRKLTEIRTFLYPLANTILEAVGVHQQQ